MGDIRQEPSMEEILASIKRVIAEDGRAAAPRVRRAAAPAEPSEPAPAAQEDVLELDDPVADQDGLMSEDAAAASRRKLAALSALGRAADAPPAPDQGPLEAVIRDMLRPMLKDWLDQHLPEIVEELVTREIARITGKPL
ncbi:MAG: DUF2497 domain-containing protein [Allosphingosinicella sp.]|uniref:DUF2497 domain-containing protein n=1 Tax=Allosphingosinicella sp. TaxID=2823234 RepID=UPI00395731EA